MGLTTYTWRVGGCFLRSLHRQSSVLIMLHSLALYSNLPQSQSQEAQSYRNWQSQWSQELSSQKAPSERLHYPLSVPFTSTGIDTLVFVTCHMAIWSRQLINCIGQRGSDSWPPAKRASLDSMLANVRTVGPFLLPCKKRNKLTSIIHKYGRVVLAKRVTVTRANQSTARQMHQIVFHSVMSYPRKEEEEIARLSRTVWFQTWGHGNSCV